MDKETAFILWFDQITNKDSLLVGGKNASLGEMYSKLMPLGVNVPNGFAVTTFAYRHFLEKNNLQEKINAFLEGLDTGDMKALQEAGEYIRGLVLGGEFPFELKQAVEEAYRHLGFGYKENPDVAVRSSATLEDIEGAAFAGQMETFLGVTGSDNVLSAIKKCFASLFTDRAISYRKDKGFSSNDAAISVGIQKMVRSDLASSGVAFTIDPETGFENAIVINSIYGLGELIVQGGVIPDEWVLFKPSLLRGAKAILVKKLGVKNKKIVYKQEGGVKLVAVEKEAAGRFSLSEEEVYQLALWCQKIEEHFSYLNQKIQPMDIEWAKDGLTNEIFIVQARPETVYSTKQKNIWEEYIIKEKGEVAVKGIAVGAKVASGIVRVIKNTKEIGTFQKGEVLVTEMTDPDWEPIMKIASGIITDKGGRTSHAAIVSRELGVSCVVGTKEGTNVLKTGDEVTIDCSSGSEGIVYKGILPHDVIAHDVGNIPKTSIRVMVNIGSPDEAFRYHYLPVKGVGLGRLEFIIAGNISIHPNALIDYDAMRYSETWQNDKKARLAAARVIKKIDELTKGYEDKREYYVEKLAYGIAKIGAAFWPEEVIVRFSDFKTNEYRTLIGGEFYEPNEENPMIGWRGAARYYDEKFIKAFGLECRALARVRYDMQLYNVVPMIPFCRTPAEGEKVVEIMREHGLDRAQDKDLSIYVMCEIPSNILLADEFLEIFDGMSIGSNDLTQLTLGLDRDSDIVAGIANENNEAVKKLIGAIIMKCKEKGKYIGICGQAPSDFPEFTEFLVEKGIDSISLNPDTVIKTILAIAEKEKEVNV